MKKLLIQGCVVWLAGLVLSCSSEPIPKPRGYFKIDLPTAEYVSYTLPCPFELEVPKHARIELREKQSVDTCWFNVSYPKLNAKLYVTYLPISNNFDDLIADAYEFAAKHEVKASAMKRSLFEDRENKLYGIMYDIEGEAASQIQFFITDSTRHFLRASLYFNNRPNPDSIAPVLAFLRKDIVHMAESVRWK